jgi:hypothetical protein
MRQLKRFKTAVVGVAVVAAPAAMLVLAAGTAAAQPPPSPSPGPSPNPQGATKVTISNQNRNCDGSAASPNGSGSGSGFAVINAPAEKKVIANVNLTNAAPNATYDVRLIELPQSSNPCPVNPANGVFGGTLQTDASGNGQVNVQGPLVSGKNAAFADLNNTTAPNTDFYTSPVVTFSG